MSKKDTKNLKLIQGEVVSDKMEKTRVVLVSMHRTHPVFRKSILTSRKYKVHDEKDTSSLGDIVLAAETRPLSRDKRHRLLKVIEKAK